MAELTRKDTFSIPPSGWSDLGEIAKNVAHLDKIIAIATAEPRRDSLGAIASATASAISISDDAARRLLDGLSTLHHLKSRLRITADELVESLTRSLESQATSSWKAENLDRWKNAKSKLVGFLDDRGAEDAVGRFQKSRELEFSHQNILYGSRIITDIRPVFNKLGDGVVEAIVAHSLIVEYSEGSQTRRIEFAMDTDDMLELRRACERAELKTATLSSSLEKLNWPIRVAGEEGERDT